jgi:hypothetical protein
MAIAIHKQNKIFMCLRTRYGGGVRRRGSEEGFGGGVRRRGSEEGLRERFGGGVRGT